ncbi:hypothetical protein F0562_011356 [Nyssa sinensis]|uniref:SHSP domain-containing protein n=1 Tax=Nyssa sinensis TaxID=561372 RepID=A0A5J5A4Q0_9ASTE|nr:hypothetical protein F0562_011356 [Nyssa sinensis]
MESQLVRRRMNTLAGHFASADDISATATHLFPMNCSSSLNSVIQRRDNRMFFARQGSGSQACFMRPVPTEQPQNCSSSLNSVFRRCDNRMYFARQGSSSQACFMRPVSTEQGSSAQSSVPLKCTRSAREGSSNASEEPLFSRPARLEPNFLNVGVIQPLVLDYELPAPEPPKFARPNRRTSGQKQKQYPSKKKIHASESHGFEWSPRMDVAESACNYIVTVELPGVSINDIRVEVNDKTLNVMGKRSTQFWKVESFSNDSISAYHKREILQGPYQVAWSLPNNVNKDGVSAEILDGFLRITIPKL